MDTPKGGVVVLHSNGTRIDVTFASNATNRCVSMIRINQNDKPAKYQVAKGGGSFSSTKTFQSNTTECLGTGQTQLSIKNVESSGKSGDSDIFLEWPNDTKVVISGYPSGSTCTTCGANFSPRCKIN